jgi:hypothetical protein
VCHSEPFSKIAKSVVPPPTSMSATPSSFSSADSTASAEASCSRTVSRTSMPARLTQVTRFCTEGVAAVTMWTFASSLVPVIPSGEAIPF